MVAVAAVIGLTVIAACIRSMYREHHHETHEKHIAASLERAYNRERMRQAFPKLCVDLREAVSIQFVQNAVHPNERNI